MSSPLHKHEVPQRKTFRDVFAQTRRHGGHSAAVSPKTFLSAPNFVVLRKICLKHMIKVKIFRQ